jgi:undecaprenyl-diphosphatase
MDKKYKQYNIYVASAVYDTDIKWHITHKIDPDLDTEREYFFNKLNKT